MQIDRISYTELVLFCERCAVKAITVESQPNVIVDFFTKLWPYLQQTPIVKSFIDTVLLLKLNGFQFYEIDNLTLQQEFKIYDW